MLRIGTILHLVLRKLTAHMVEDIVSRLLVLQSLCWNKNWRLRRVLLLWNVFLMLRPRLWLHLRLWHHMLHLRLWGLNLIFRHWRIRSIAHRYWARLVRTLTIYLWNLVSTLERLWPRHQHTWTSNIWRGPAKLWVASYITLLNTQRMLLSWMTTHHSRMLMIVIRSSVRWLGLCLL